MKVSYGSNAIQRLRMRLFNSSYSRRFVFFIMLKTQTHTYTDDNGQTQTSMRTVWTEEGREFIHNLFTKTLQSA